MALHSHPQAVPDSSRGGAAGQLLYAPCSSLLLSAPPGLRWRWELTQCFPTDVWITSCRVPGLWSAFLFTVSFSPRPLPGLLVLAVFRLGSTSVL